MVRRILFVLLAACGGKAQTVAPPLTAKPAAPPPPATASCADADVLLSSDGEIRERCISDKWPVTVIECVASKQKPEECLEDLPDAARDRAFEVVGTREDGGDDDFGDPPPEIECADMAFASADFPPIVDDTAPARDWTIKVRRNILEHECDHGWSFSLKSCLESSSTANDTSQCLTDHLEADERDELTRELEDINKLAAKLEALKKKPKTIGCKQVVAAHYSDAKWKSKLDGFPAKERKKLIADSRNAMTKACTADAWDDTLRACIVAGGDTTCFESSGMGMQWGYPAAGVVMSLGIPECDAYGAEIKRVIACDKIPQASRDALKQAFDVTQAAMASASIEDRKKMAPSCAAGMDAVKQVAASVGC